MRILIKMSFEVKAKPFKLNSQGWMECNIYS